MQQQVQTVPGPAMEVNHRALNVVQNLQLQSQVLNEQERMEQNTNLMNANQMIEE